MSDLIGELRRFPESPPCHFASPNGKTVPSLAPGTTSPETGFTLRVPAITPNSKLGGGSRLGRLSGPVPSSAPVGPNAAWNSAEPPS